MAHGLESGASVAHRRCAVGDPVQLVLFLTLLSGQHQHRDGGDASLNTVPVAAHELSVAFCSPAMVRTLPAPPVILLCPLAVIRSEVEPAGLLGYQRIKPLSHKLAVVHQLRSFVATVRGEVTLQLAERNPGQAQPAAVSQQNRQLPGPDALPANFMQDLTEADALGIRQSGERCTAARMINHGHLCTGSCPPSRSGRCS